MKHLGRVKEQQLADVETLERERTELKSKVGGLLEKLNELKTKQEELSDRYILPLHLLIFSLSNYIKWYLKFKIYLFPDKVCFLCSAERVLRHASMKQPVVSNAEVQMRKDLSIKQKKLEEMKDSLENVKKYSLDQKTQVCLF